MKCYCCRDNNTKNINCIDCSNIVCFKCINELIPKNTNWNILEKIKVCNKCITNTKYDSYTNLMTPDLKRDLEEGLQFQCEYCLNIWDGNAQCDCIERIEYNDMIEDKNENIFTNNYNTFKNQFYNYIDLEKGFSGYIFKDNNKNKENKGNKDKNQTYTNFTYISEMV